MLTTCIMLALALLHLTFLALRLKLELCICVWHSAIAWFLHYVQHLHYACIMALRQTVFRLLFQPYRRQMLCDVTIHNNAFPKSRFLI